MCVLLFDNRTEFWQKFKILNLHFIKFHKFSFMRSKLFWNHCRTMMHDDIMKVMRVYPVSSLSLFSLQKSIAHNKKYLIALVCSKIVLRYISHVLCRMLLRCAVRLISLSNMHVARIQTRFLNSILPCVRTILKRVCVCHPLHTRRHKHFISVLWFRSPVKQRSESA